ncbi:MAG: 4-hydroxy-tetrahydrodipicolinate synthase [Erysipelotrichales bacterium]|nr:4-hydroxy-tetrahydrodipicolinate synthase [Erysipelotrichales bacterium]
MFKPYGIICPVSTPLNDDETINEAELRRQCDRIVDAGLQGIFPLGTNGENYAMEFEEKVRVLEIVIDQINHRIPVYAGTGCVSTKGTIELTKKAKELGADVASIVTPYYAAVSQEGLIRHYTAIAEAVDIPILIYNMPARTGVNVAPATVAKLAKIPNIVGVKDSSGNFDNMLQYFENTDREEFSVLSGNDSLILWCLQAGGTGGIAGLSNVFPERIEAIYQNFLKGNFAKALEIENSIRPLRKVMASANPNSVIKRAATFMGQNMGPCKAPFDLQSEAIDEAIKAALAYAEKTPLD